MKITAPTQGPMAVAANESPDKNERALHKEAKELESVFLRKLLEESKVGQGAESSGYASMGVDALANAISDAGGLGLAKMIEHAITAKTHRAK